MGCSNSEKYVSFIIGEPRKGLLGAREYGRQWFPHCAWKLTSPFLDLQICGADTNSIALKSEFQPIFQNKSWKSFEDKSCSPQKEWGKLWSKLHCVNWLFKQNQTKDSSRRHLNSKETHHIIVNISRTQSQIIFKKERAKERTNHVSREKTIHTCRPLRLCVNTAVTLPLRDLLICESEHS